MSSRLVYQDRRHRYSLDNAYVPSVTTITGVLDKPGLVWAAAKETATWAANHATEVDVLGADAWVQTATRAHREVWDAKRDRGTDLHTHAEQLVRTGYTDAPEAQVPLVESAADFLDTWDVVPQHSEALVFSADRRYAGRLDLLATLADGQRWLLDFKTGAGVYPEMALQQAAYRFASHLVVDGTDRPMPEVDAVGIVHVQPDGWSLVPLKAGPEEFATFLACRVLWTFRQQPDDVVVLPPLSPPEVIER